MVFFLRAKGLLSIKAAHLLNPPLLGASRKRDRTQFSKFCTLRKSLRLLPKRATCKPMCRGLSDLFCVLPSALAAAASLLDFWLLSTEADEEAAAAALEHLVTNSKKGFFVDSTTLKKLFAAPRSSSSSARSARSPPAAGGAPAAVCGLDGSATGGGEGKEGQEGRRKRGMKDAKPFRIMGSSKAIQKQHTLEVNCSND